MPIRLLLQVSITMLMLLQVVSVGAQSCGTKGECFSENQTEQYRKAMMAVKAQQWQDAELLLSNLYLEAPHTQQLTNNYAVVLAKLGKKAEAALILERFLLEHQEVGVSVANLLRAYENLALTGTAAADLGLQLALMEDQPEINHSPVTFEPVVKSPLQASIATPKNPEAVLRQVSGKLQDFSKAWSKGDIDRYLDFYWPNISPNPKLSATQWKQQRRQRVSPARDISVRIELIDAYFNPEGAVITEFLQHYQANNYQDTSIKTMAWKQNGSVWKIISERSQ